MKLSPTQEALMKRILNPRIGNAGYFLLPEDIRTALALERKGLIFIVNGCVAKAK